MHVKQVNFLVSYRKEQVHHTKQIRLNLAWKLIATQV